MELKTQKKKKVKTLEVNIKCTFLFPRLQTKKEKRRKGDKRNKKKEDVVKTVTKEVRYVNCIHFNKTF